MHLAMIPLHEQIGAALGEMRQLFADIGMPIIDMVNFKKSPMGTFKIQGWGKGVPVSHPQAKFIEAILNGTAPEFSNLTNKIAAIFDKIEKAHGQIQDLKEKNSKLTGKSFFRQKSFFDGGVTMGTEHQGRIMSSAKTLSRQKVGLFNDFKSSLGAELGKLTQEQIFSRFHYSAVILPSLPDDILKYL